MLLLRPNQLKKELPKQNAKPYAVEAMVAGRITYLNGPAEQNKEMTLISAPVPTSVLKKKRKKRKPVVPYLIQRKSATTMLLATIEDPAALASAPQSITTISSHAPNAGIPCSKALGIVANRFIVAVVELRKGAHGKSIKELQFKTISMRSPLPIKGGIASKERGARNRLGSNMPLEFKDYYQHHK